VAIQAYNHSTQQVEAGGSQVQIQPWLYSELKVNLSYIVGPVFKKKMDERFEQVFGKNYANN
jgi:hypothetical protein